MTQPLDRQCELPALGDLDSDAGEFWVENPFMLKPTGNNLSAYERNRMYLNRNGTEFLDASFASNTDIDSDSRSAIAADFDRDGHVDLFVGSSGGGPLRLFSNQFPRTHHRVRLVLEGSDSNRAGIGSRITLQCGDRQIVRDVFLHNGCLGMSPADLIVGVGDATTIDRLTVRWPTGKAQSFENLPVDAHITLTEGKAEAAHQMMAATASAAAAP